MSESERSYAETCIKVLRGDEVYRRRCECEAGVVASKLTPGELKAYVSFPEIQGKPLTAESAIALGFTLDDYSNLGKKLQASFEEVSKTCARK